MDPHSDQGAGPVGAAAPDAGRVATVRGKGRQSAGRSPAGSGAVALVPPSRWLTVLAFVVVAVPFAVAVIRLLADSSGHIYLADDLALIDLHTRRALQWKQQLGVFDHNGWNHPGPTYFYLLSVVYRVLGSGARSLFVGATLINALAAVACLGVVRRRTASPGRTLWAAFWICLLASVLAVVGPASVAYSESPLGGLVSPWNPMVVIFPLLLFVLLGAGAMDRSALSLAGAVLVGSFVVQTNISTLPLVAAIGAVAAVTFVVTAVMDRRIAQGSVASDAPVSGVSRRAWAWVWFAAGAVAFVLMWLPPVVQQFTNHPGNITLIDRFFTAGYPGHTLRSGIDAVTAVFGILVEGPAEVMRSNLAIAPHHEVVAGLVTLVVLVAGVAATVVALRQRLRFAAGLGVLGLVGTLAMVVAVTRLVGHLYGYLVVWAVALPIALVIGVGMIRLPLALRSSSPAASGPPLTSTRTFRLLGCVVAVGVCVVSVVRVAAIPPLSAASDPQVGALASLVVPALGHDRSVFVNDSGAGNAADDSQLLDVEKFIGLVNLLSVRGYHPTVNKVWRAQFGPGFEADGTEAHSIELRTWTPESPSILGYLGRVGDIAVTESTAVDGHSTDPGDSPG
jgi:hypothetical protein